MAGSPRDAPVPAPPQEDDMDLRSYVTDLCAGVVATPSFVAAVRQHGRTAEAVRALVPLAGYDPKAAEALASLAPGVR